MSSRSRLVIGICAAAIAAAQTAPPAPPAQSAPTEPQQETTTKEQPATFKARVNLVMVPVVVRDKAGHAVGTLKQEDFQLFDKGKPQYISRFSVEKSGVAADAKGKPAPKSDPGEGALEMPERYFA